MLRVAVAGAGFMGRGHAERWAGLEGVRVIGVYSRTLAHAQALAGPLGASATDRLEALLQLPADAVDVCLPANVHHGAVLTALAAGRHVVCEKPLALRLTHAREMAATARAAGRLLLVAHVLRFWPGYARLCTLVQQGWVGRPTSAVAQRLQACPEGTSDDDARARSGGQVVDLQIHDDDLLLQLFGLPRSVRAQGGDRHVFTFLDFDGVAAIAEAGSDMPAGYPFRSSCRVQGDGGILEYAFEAKGARPDQAGGGSPGLTVWRPGRSPEQLEVPPGDPYTLELAHFADCLRRGEPSPLVTPEDAVRALRVALAARRSLAAGAPVAL